MTEAELFNAVSTGDIYTLNALIQSKVNISKKYGKTGRTALIISILHKQKHVTHRLLEAEVDVNMKDTKNGSSALLYAVEMSDIELVKTLILFGADVNTQNNEKYSPLHLAIQNKSFDMFQILIENRININLVDAKGQTALFCTTDSVNMSSTDNTMSCHMADILIKLGSNVNHKDADDWTVLHHAAANSNSELVKLLLQCKADVNALTNQNQTALMLAAASNQSQNCLLLIQFEAKIDEQDHDKDTALTLAVSEGHKTTVTVLLDKGANRILKNKQGFTAIDIAVKRNFSEICECLNSFTNYTFDQTDNIEHEHEHESTHKNKKKVKKSKQRNSKIV